MTQQKMQHFDNGRLGKCGGKCSGHGWWQRVDAEKSQKKSVWSRKALFDIRGRFTQGP